MIANSAGVRKSLSPFTGEAKRTPSSLILHISPKLHTWKPPLSVKIGLFQPSNWCSPPNCFMMSCPGRIHKGCGRDGGHPPPPHSLSNSLAFASPLGHGLVQKKGVQLIPKCPLFVNKPISDPRRSHHIPLPPRPRIAQCNRLQPRRLWKKTPPPQRHL